MIYYIADLHFGDERVMELAKRPFKNVADMDATLIHNWNEIVTKDDWVYVIGDIAINQQKAMFISKLHGHKVLIRGNHDKELNDDNLKQFEQIDTIKTILDNGRSVCLCHYPLLSYENSIYGGYQVFGHIHNNHNDIAFELQRLLPRSFNASADVIGFKPRTLDELITMKENGLI